MFRNYIQTAIRSIFRERYYAIIKIAGLALGLGTSMVLMLYVSHQLSYDNFHPDGDRTYRVNQTAIWNPAGGISGSTAPAVSIALREDFPEIEEILRVNTPDGYTVRYQESNGNVLAFNETEVLAADSNFFSFFDFKLKEGDAHTALIGKGKVVLSDKAAKKLFGDQPALGKIVLFGDDRMSMEVTGVTEVQPVNSHFHFEYLISMPSNPAVKDFEWSWIWTQLVTYVKLKPGADVNSLEAKLKTFADRHAPATFEKLHMDYKEFIAEKGAWSLYLQPVQDIYLYSAKIGNRLGALGDITYVYVLGAIALFILLIAVINFINLSTARASARAKEIGVKKTLGLMRGSLIAQFQIEHILVTLISMLFGLGVMELLRLLIQPLVGIYIPISAWSPVLFVVVIITLPVAVGFLAGLYPSFYLTSFRPAQVLKGKVALGFRSSGLRNGLVVFQFSISIALMAGTLIIFKQLNYFQSQSVGFDKENLLVIHNVDKLGKQMDSFRDEVMKLPGVTNATLSMDIRETYNDMFLREGSDTKLSISQYKIDENFFNTTQMSMAAGRGFEINRPSDQNAVVINSTTAQSFGWTPEQAVGKRIIYPGDDFKDPLEIIGVVNDFTFQSLHQNITPVIFFHTRSNMWDDVRTVIVKYNSKEVARLINDIQKKWNTLSSETPFSTSFYDEELRRRYEQEQHMASLFTVFTSLSITIAVIGLVGLVAYSAEQRKKEIGIRKVFGASLTNVYVMINKQYVRLVVIALFISTPLAWWLMEQWLDTFPYRTPINIWIFVTSGVIELVLALICVGYLALRAASLNPAIVLKEE